MSELVSKVLVKEIVDCVSDCGWSCQEEIECYIYSTINDIDEYEPDDWCVGGCKWDEVYGGGQHD